MLVCAFAIGGCGPDVTTDDVFPRNCGADGPVDLFDPGNADVRTAEIVGDHVVVVLADGMWTEVVAVERCGGAPRMLIRTESDDLPVLGPFGDELLACDRTSGTIDRLDLRGEAPPERLFDATDCCVYPVADGLAARNTVADTIEFVADPGARAPTRATIVTGANEPDSPATPTWLDHFVDCGRQWDDIEPVALGDVLLVPLRGGLVTVDPRSGERDVIVEEELHSLRPVDEERYALWSVDGTETFLFDRTDLSSTQVGTWAGWVDPLGEWIVDIPGWPYPDGVQTVAMHLPDGATYVVTTDVIPDPFDERGFWNTWWASSPLSPESLIVDVPVEHFGSDVPKQSHVFWPATGALEPVDLPPPNYSARVETDAGIFAFDDDAIRFLPPEGPPMRTLLDTRPVHAAATADAQLVYVDADDGQTSGILRVLVPDGDTYEIDRDVIRPVRAPADWVHHHDDADVVYLANVDGHTIVRRTVLP